MNPLACSLEGAVGRQVACPEDACAFWEPGGAVLPGRCALGGIDFSHEPGLAGWLLEFRDGLAPTPSGRRAAGHELRRVLSQGHE